MNKKYFLMAALAAGMLTTACNSSNDLAEGSKPQEPQVSNQVPVGFAAYADRGTTRSGVSGDLDLDALKEAAGVAPVDGGGFGVFAYYTDLKKYDQTYVPNFMYNQGVFWNSGTSKWEYSPVMYWPNESGADAQSDDEDKVSFFAYAPYVKHTSAASGSVNDATYGITGFSRNSTAGDPIVKYIASFNASETVDLCWGVCNSASWQKFQGAGTQTMTAGLPWLDVEHPQLVDQNLTFTFKHALAQLAVTIDADPDIAAHDAVTVLEAGTKIYVRSISFTGIAMKGALNLNNPVANTARWLDYSGSTDLPYGESVTVKDGRRDGREGASGAEATNELPQGLNPVIVQNNPATAGVTATPVDLFAGGTVFMIPTGETMTVTIVYDVETESPDLTTYISDGATHGSSIENRISKTITWSSGTGLVSGKKYNLALHLGMNSVKFDAEVADWDPTAIDANAWLPSNVASFAAANPAAAASVTLPAATTTYTFGVKGLDAVEDVTTTPTTVSASTTDGEGTANKSNALGGVLTEVTGITANTETVKKDAGSVAVTGSTSSKGVTVTIKQDPAALGLAVNAVSNGASTITVTKTATNAWDAASSESVAASYAVTKNGVALTKVDSAPAADSDEFKFDNGTITLGTAAATDDVFVITIKTGDAPAETKSVTVS
ncbi:MAG: fimbrillin family protein [Prevotella sp.]|nr:fimbrillin family protein [Prevotella sp.]